MESLSNDAPQTDRRISGRKTYRDLKNVNLRETSRDQHKERGNSEIYIYIYLFIYVYIKVGEHTHAWRQTRELLSYDVNLSNATSTTYPDMYKCTKSGAICKVNSTNA